MRYRQSPCVETSQVGDRVVLYDSETRQAIVLNPTGAWLWNELKTSQSSAQLAQSLQQRFPQIAAAQLQSDVDICVRELLQQQLIREEE